MGGLKKPTRSAIINNTPALIALFLYEFIFFSFLCRRAWATPQYDDPQPCPPYDETQPN
jgi:hypothetical protein